MSDGRTTSTLGGIKSFVVGTKSFWFIILGFGPGSKGGPSTQVGRGVSLVLYLSVVTVVI